ncbi:hypothetical protein RFI_32045 [Reticulomyxa filosa]|uniref:Uncharacterized protein n=1 Tax=Reticulomyxa filosa TaxID=46433 RepID=X6LVG2_RETFI|nr:hypothetical protein RFI_32045 [Reticulomyxa filosa]|eukprot:ETO05351.1 hypothetical protein RFI_32045 [Reticulomyxa filosa]
MLAAQRTVMELIQNMQMQIIDTNAALYKMQRQLDEAGNQKQQMEEQTKEVIQRQDALQQDILTIGQQNQNISQQIGTVLGWIEETKGKLDGVNNKTEEIVERITGVDRKIDHSMCSKSGSARSGNISSSSNTVSIPSIPSSLHRNNTESSKSFGQDGNKQENRTWMEMKTVWESATRERTKKLILFGHELNGLKTIGQFIPKLREITTKIERKTNKMHYDREADTFTEEIVRRVTPGNRQ